MADIESYDVVAANNTGLFPENQAPSTVNNGGRQGQADQKAAYNRINGDITAGGTADALTATFTPAHTSHVAGRVLVITAASANATTTPTFTLDGLSAKTIKKHGGQALVAGDIYGAGHELLLKDAGTYYELMNPADFSSGTWTPTLQDASLSDGEGQTYSHQYGSYTKVGNRVFIHGSMKMTAIGTLTGPEARIAGLPFTSSSTSNSDGGVTVTYMDGTAAPETPMTGLVVPNTTHIRLYETSTGSISTGVSVGNDIVADTGIKFYGQYIV